MTLDPSLMIHLHSSIITNTFPTKWNGSLTSKVAVDKLLGWLCQIMSWVFDMQVDEVTLKIPSIRFLMAKIHGYPIYQGSGLILCFHSMQFKINIENSNRIMKDGEWRMEAMYTNCFQTLYCQALFNYFGNNYFPWWHFGARFWTTA